MSAPSRELETTRSSGFGFGESWIREAAIVLVAFAVYARTLWYSFLFDDVTLIVRNPTVHSWRFLPHYFTGDFWQNVEQPTGYYRPMALLWFRLNDAAFGLHPFWWHATNLLLHATACVLVYRLARRLTGDRTVALLAGLLFAVHPVHVETVSWICDSVDALVTVFFVASVVCFLRWREGPRGWLLASLLCYCGAMLTKEPGFVLPAVLFFYVVLVERRRSEEWATMVQRGCAAIAWYVPLSVVYLVVRKLVLHRLSMPLQEVSATSFLLTIPTLLWGYARALVLPFWLSEFYDYSLMTPSDWPSVLWAAAGVLALLGLFGLLLYRGQQDGRVSAFLLAWCVLTLFLTLNLRALSPGEMVHDRYLYLPSVGFAIAAAMVLGKLNFGKTRFPLAALLVIAGLGVLSVKQEEVWRHQVAGHTLRWETYVKQR